MADWLFESAPPSPESLIGYSVLDAVGMRFGQVDGWLRDPEGEVVMFAMTARLLMRAQRVLVPLGYVTQLDLGRRNVHLREITRRSLDFYSVRFDEGLLPSTDLLVDKLRESPYVRPEIRLLLADPHRVQPLQPTRLWALGDGRADPSDLPLGPAFLPLDPLAVDPTGPPGLPADPPARPEAADDLPRWYDAVVGGITPPPAPPRSAPVLPQPGPLVASAGPGSGPAWKPLGPLGDDLVPSWRSLESVPFRPGDAPAEWR